MIESMVQLGLKAADVEQEVLQQLVAIFAVAHSGWNCVANSLRSAHSIEATGRVGGRGDEDPSGTRLTASRWLIHGLLRRGCCHTGRFQPWRTITAGPYSALLGVAPPYRPA